MDFIQQLFIFVSVYFGQTFGVMFGGGGFFIQPALLAADIPAKEAVANDIAAAAFSVAAYLITTKTRSDQIKNVTLRIAPSVLIGALMGSYLLTQIPESIVKWIILTVCSIGFLYVLTHFKKKKKTASTSPINNWKIILPAAGIGLGFYDGFIGAGGGIIVIMALSMIIRSDMKSTISMANWVGVISLGSATLMYWYQGLLNWPLLCILIPAGLLAGFTGAKITERLSEKTLKATYCVIISCLLVYLISSEIM